VLASELRNDPWKVALAQFRGRRKRRLIMNKMIIPPVLAGLLTLGFALPAMADDTDEATLTTVRSRVCYDSDGDRVPCRGRYYRYDRDYYSQPGVRLEFGVGDRRHRYRDRYWD
jgi:hypothetical protein